MSEIKAFYPLVSIIMFINNEKEDFAKSLNSTINQTYKNIEIIVIDNGISNDNVNIIKNVNKRVKIYKFEKSNNLTLFAFALKKIKGKYFSFLNCNEIYHHQKISEQVLSLSKLKNKNTIIICDFDKKDETNKEVYEYNYSDLVLEHPLRTKSQFFPLLYNLIKESTFLIPKEVINILEIQSVDEIELDLYFFYQIFIKFSYKIVFECLLTPLKIDISNEIKSKEMTIDYDDLYINILNNLTKNEYKNLAHSKLDLFLDLEKIFKNNNLVNAHSFIRTKFYKNVQIATNDLVGNKFNGFDLHIQLRNRGIDSKQIVLNKESMDENTYAFNFADFDATKKLIMERYFFEANILHLHHIHNILDLNYLPIITGMIPTVITLHEPFFFAAHCVHSFDCNKWRTHCYDCPYLSIPFSIDKDYTALNFEIKKNAIQNSQISVIVASEWMKDRVLASPIWKNKKVYKIPFGIDDSVFNQTNKLEIRKKMNIPKDSVVLMFRADSGAYKGLDIIEKSLENTKTHKTVIIITVGEKDTLINLKKKYKIIQFDWIKNDELLSQLYQVADIFLMPSRYETFGMMALEAMSCGTMVLGLDTKDSAISEVINPPLCGVVAKEEGFSAELNRLINNIEEVKVRGERSLKHVRKNNSLECFLDNIEEVYKEIMANHILNESSKVILQQLNKHMLETNESLKDKNVTNVSFTNDMNSNSTFKIKRNLREIFRRSIPLKIRKKIMKIANISLRETFRRNVPLKVRKKIMKIANIDVNPREIFRRIVPLKNRKKIVKFFRK